MKTRVGVFFGGRSVEHEVSIISALQGINAMNKEKYEAVPVYITKEGIMYTGEALLDVENFKDLKTLLPKCKQVAILNNKNEKVMIKYPLSKFANNVLGSIDVAIPIIHGTNGEDGTLQGFFEALCIPYAGCDVLSSAVGMDKVVAKTILRDAGVPVVDHVWFYSTDWLKKKEEIISKIEEKISYPMIIKPANTGSSVGVKKVNRKEDLEDAIEEARSFTNKVMAEPMVQKLREINCSVLGDFEEAKASVCEEPVAADDILSYKDKYLSNGSGSKGMSSATREIPAKISDELTTKIRKLATDTFSALGCSGVIRIDFLMNNETKEVYVNEVNTIPGSLSFYLWEATGVSFEKLMDELIRLALKKSRDKEALMFTYDTNILSLNGGLKGAKGIK